MTNDPNELADCLRALKDTLEDRRGTTHPDYHMAIGLDDILVQPQTVPETRQKAVIQAKALLSKHGFSCPLLTEKVENSQPSTQSHAREKGLAAGDAGKRAIENPYDTARESNDHDDWAQGRVDGTRWH